MIGDAYVLCMRVQSNRPKVLNNKETGWLHPVGASAPPRPVHEEKPAPIINVDEILKQWRGRGTVREVTSLAVKLGVTNRSLEVLDCVRAPYKNAWAFPMSSGEGGYVGIRLRNENGEKWAERGSHQGLFLPWMPASAMAMIVEGPTDAAAALTLGYFAIGRPNCCGGIDHLKTAVKRLGIRRAVIVSDLDDPGLRGAATLAMHLPIPTAVLVCPAKDLRAAVKSGMDREMCDAMISQLVWRQP